MSMKEYYEERTDEMSDEDKKAYGDYMTMERAESDLHTLIEAEEIKKDPKRMKMAKHCAKTKKDAIAGIV